MKDNRRAIERRGAPRLALDRSRELGQLFFAIATHERSGVAWGTGLAKACGRCDASGGGHNQNRRCRGPFGAHLFNARHQIVEALVVPGFQDRFGRDHVDRFEARQAREQIEIRGPQAAAIRCLVADRHDHLAEHGACAR
ncbi:MAG: hypothetical protein DMF84_26390 [Acidobacteria bacterium]|nr:MAG: hypothetical protein DMF84_26390 [Acidobacteriota bacterium]